jgi:hypothetical protein
MMQTYFDTVTTKTFCAFLIRRSSLVLSEVIKVGPASPAALAVGGTIFCCRLLVKPFRTGVYQWNPNVTLWFERNLTKVSITTQCAGLLVCVWRALHTLIHVSNHGFHDVSRNFTEACISINASVSCGGDARAVAAVSLNACSIVAQLVLRPPVCGRQCHGYNQWPLFLHPFASLFV